MKQKVIVRVSMADEKSRKKAMKTVVGHTGVESAALQGQDKNQIEVIGDGIDSVKLTTLLRKNVGYTELLSVNSIPEKKDGGDQKKDGDVKKNEVITFHPPVIWNTLPQNGGVPHFVEFRDTSYDNTCTIM